MGYQTYAIGNFTYELTQDSEDVTFHWEGLRGLKKTKSSVKKVSYKILIAVSSESLKAAMNCEIYSPEEGFYSSTVNDESASKEGALTVKVNLCLFRNLK